MSTSETELKCYRGACNNTANVKGYNRVTHGLYCKSCAIEIHRSSEDLNLFPLLFIKIPDGGSLRRGVILVREAQYGKQ